MDTLRFYELSKLGDTDAEERPILDNFVEEVDDDIWRLLEGESIKQIWPEKARIYLTGTEGGIELGDLVGTTRNVIIASTRFKDLIQRHCTKVPVEYLAVAIHDHRKRILSDDYFVINPLGAHDCIDLDKSRVLWSTDSPKKVLAVDDIVIDRKRGAKAPQLFRPEHARATYVLRYDLALEVKDADLPNVVWSKLKTSE